jgi:hypothetical protein
MKYLRFLVVPLAALLIFAIQAGGLLLRGPLPDLPLVAVSGQDLRLFLERSARRAGVAVIKVLDWAGADVSAASGDAIAAARLLLVDEPFRPLPGGKPAGPFDSGFDTVRNAAIVGGHVVIGFNCLVGTENPRLAAELAAWSGAGALRWIGIHTVDLSASGELPAIMVQAWERQHGRFWDWSGAGIILYDPSSSRVVVLRRGYELDRHFMTADGRLAGIPVSTLFGGYFVITTDRPDDEVVIKARLGLRPEGRLLAQRFGIPESFPLVAVKPYGSGAVWTITFDLFRADASRPGLGLYPSPRIDALRTLDEPGDGNARFTRLIVPLWRAISLAILNDSITPGLTMTAEAVADAVPPGKVADSTAGTASATPQASRQPFRAGTAYLERQDAAGRWQAWFVKGVNLGPATPGHWFGDPPTDDSIYLAWFDDMHAAGFDAIRVYTLLPPAFYRALVDWNSRVDKPLYLIQEIWPEEHPPDDDLGDPDYLNEYMAESDRTLDALFGKADIAERSFRAWGVYRADVSPWLAAVLVGRELEPHEVLATAKARPDTLFTGRWFRTDPGWPVESVLAAMAERAAQRIEQLGGIQIPIGFVSWPTLDVLHHPAEWPAGSQSAPFNDRAAVDFRAIHAQPGNTAGFFAAFHIYPNYPDFMIRSARFEKVGDERGYLRYAAYLDELLPTLDGIPLLIAEFGLATGYGTAHLHPEGLHHGGLSEAEQAEGIIGLFLTMAERGAAGGVVFQWADEWAKKTWTTEPYMIPYDRNPMWHNVIDPEQNYGIMNWVPPVQPASITSDRGLRAWQDAAFLYLRSELPSGLTSSVCTMDIGLDVVPGRTGETRLYPGGPSAPLGAEFVIRAAFDAGRLTAADLLVHSDYNRGGGRLFPRDSSLGGFTRIMTLVNAASRNQEGRSFQSLWEDGSTLPLGPHGLAEQLDDGSVIFRLPWSRLNFADPSQRRILLDPIRDARVIVTTDSLQTMVIDELLVWCHVREPGLEPFVYYPDVQRPFRIALAGWEVVNAAMRAKPAHAALAEFLGSWDPLAEANKALD